MVNFCSKVSVVYCWKKKILYFSETTFFRTIKQIAISHDDAYHESMSYKRVSDFFTWAQKLHIEIYRKLRRIIIACHEVPTVQSVERQHGEKYVGEKAHLASNNKNTLNAGHVLTLYLRKLLGRPLSWTEDENCRLFQKYSEAFWPRNYHPLIRTWSKRSVYNASE